MNDRATLIRLASLALALAAQPLPAQATYQWDPKGAEPGLGGGGTWTPKDAFCDALGTGQDDGTDAPVAHEFAEGDTAIFAGTAGRVRLGVEPLPHIQVQTGDYQFFHGPNWNASFPGNLSIASEGVTQFHCGGNSARNFEGTVDLNGGILRITGGNRLTRFLAPIIGKGSLLYEGGAGMILGENRYSGITVLAAGISDLQHAKAFGSSEVLFQGGGIDSTVAGIRLADNPMTWSEDFVFRGSKDLHLGSGPVTLAESISIDTQASTLSLGGELKEARAGLSLSKSGPGTLALNGIGRYTGQTEILCGVLCVNSPKTLYGGDVALWGQNLSIAEGGALGLSVGGEGEFTHDEMNQTLTALMRRGVFAAGSSIAFDTSGAKNGVFTISSPIKDPKAGSLGLVKLGTGTLVLEGQHDYSGDTLVSGGSLLVNGSLGRSKLTVAAGAAIGGSGRIGGHVHLDAEASWQVTDLDSSLEVAGLVHFPQGFGIRNLQGIDWDALEIGKPYPLLESAGSPDLKLLSHVGPAKAVGVGSQGRFAYFDENSFSVIVITEPVNQPLVLPAPEFIGPFTVAGLPREAYYFGQAAMNGIIDLTPERAFFKYPFFKFNHNRGEGDPETRYLIKEREEGRHQEAVAERSARVEEAKAVLAKRGATPDELASLDEPGDSFFPTARWHLYCAQPGEITLSFYMQVSAEQAATPWVIEMAQGEHLDVKGMAQLRREAQKLGLVESDGSKPQPQTLSFQVKQPGRVSLYLDQTKMPDAAGAVRFIRCRGSALEGGRLLQARRRPSAFYFSFAMPESCKVARTLVVETKPVEGSPAFTPLTVGFGYTGRFFGDSFLAKEAGLHWSMWGSPLSKEGELDMTLAPRIIAQDNPDSAVQISANEGTTVRGVWPFYSEPAASVIQSMRTMTEPDGSVTYYGHLYDESARAWRLYNAGQTSGGKRPVIPQSGQAELRPVRKASCFVEIPGGYGRMMNGDVRHLFARRAWLQDDKGKFHPMPFPGHQPKTGVKDEAITARSTRNMLAYPAANFDEEGWVLMGTGGIAHFLIYHEPRDFKQSVKLPHYLLPDKARSLEHLPVVLGERQVVSVSSDKATVEIDIKETGPNSKAVMFFDDHDCATHVANHDAIPKFEKFEARLAAMSPKEKEEFLKQGSHRLSTNKHRRAALAMQANGWRHQSEEQQVTPGKARFELKNLEPGKKYFYRIRIVHDEGMSWGYTSGSFTTRPN